MWRGAAQIGRPAAPAPLPGCVRGGVWGACRSERGRAAAGGNRPSCANVRSRLRESDMRDWKGFKGLLGWCWPALLLVMLRVVLALLAGRGG